MNKGQPMTGTEIFIRPAVEADLPQIHALIRELAEYERLSHVVIATEERLHATLFCARPAAEVLIASLGSITVGFALFFQNYSTFLAQPGLYLEDLFVRLDYRGRGVGRALLAKLAAIAVERNYGRVEWAVLDWNEPAIQFYKSLGAKPMDDWTVMRLTGEELRKLGTL